MAKVGGEGGAPVEVSVPVRMYLSSGVGVGVGVDTNAIWVRVLVGTMCAW